MKTTITITLLLFCMTGWGQDTLFPAVMIKFDNGITWGDTTSSLTWAGYTPPKDTFIQQSKYIWYNEATWTHIDSLPAYSTMNLVVSLWKDYKQECWNDSTWNQASSWGFDTPEDAEHDLQYWRCFKCPSYVLNELDGKYYLGYWIHKDPEKGFLDWLFKKISK